MKKKNSMVFVISSMSRGGAERVVSILSNYYVRNGWDVTIAMLWHNIVGYELDRRIKLINFSNEKISPKKYLPIVISKLTKYFLKTKPDVAISFIAENSIVTGIASKIAGVRHITSERIDPNEVKRSFILQKTINYFYKKCESVILQTERAKRFFSKKIQNKAVVIGNPIHVNAFAKEEKRKKIVTAGRLEKQKNHRMLINSFAKVSKLYPDYELHIYGEGRLRNELQKQIDEMNLGEKVYLVGNVENIHEQISDAQMFVLSSDYEGLSNALLEAMMMGIACVSTDCAGSDEVIENYENGVLVPVGDEEKITKAILKLIEDKEMRNKISANSAKSVERFKTENIINLWVKVIEG